MKFSYRQTANTTVIRFDRPGAQIPIEENASMPKHIGAAKYEILDEAERIAITLATERGRVTRRELSETAGIGKMKAVQTFKTLASKGVTEIEALREWRKTPEHIRRLLLANAFCHNCGSAEFAPG